MLHKQIGEYISWKYNLDCMFSDASTKEDLITECFNSSHAADETVTSYACHLDTLLQAIINKGQLPSVARNDILRHKFWTGLSSDMLRLQTRHKPQTATNYLERSANVRRNCSTLQQHLLSTLLQLVILDRQPLLSPRRFRLRTIQILRTQTYNSFFIGKVNVVSLGSV